MKKSEYFIIKRLKRKAEKHSLPTEYSLYFDDLARNKKDYYKTFISTFSIGIPILLFETVDNRWTILGSKSVLGYDGSTTKEIPFVNIEKVTSGSVDRVRRSDQTQLEAFKKNDLSKSEMADIAVYDMEGNVFYFHAFKGSDLFSLWNILLLGIQLNK